jgi:2-keto-3-deoxy-L-rhamnonate aldolase RhmA
MQMRTWAAAVVALFLIGLGASVEPRAQSGEALNNVVSLLASGKPALGVWTGAVPATRIAKVLATSDADFIVADLEHDIYDFRSLHSFLLEIADFHHRYRTVSRPMPNVLVKLAHRGGWDPRYEISEVMRVGPAAGVWVPIVESRAETERIVSTFGQAEQSGFEGMNLPGQGGHTGVSPLWPSNPKGQLIVVVMIETEEGVRHAEEIVSTPGVAAVHVVHLSEPENEQILKLCHKYHVVGGIDATPADVKARVAAGWRLISLGWDFGMLQRQLGDVLKTSRDALGSGGRQH